MTPEEHERLARIETVVEEVRRDVATSNDNLEKLAERLREAEDQRRQQNAFVGGVLFIGGALIAFFAFAWDVAQHLLARGAP